MTKLQWGCKQSEVCIRLQFIGNLQFQLNFAVYGFMQSNLSSNPYSPYLLYPCLKKQAIIHVWHLQGLWINSSG